MRCLGLSWLLILGCGGSTDKLQDIRNLDELTLEVTEEQPKTDPSIDVDTLPDGWVDLQELVPEIVLDIKYATGDNFVGIPLYPCARCLLRRAVAAALIEVYQELRAQNLGLKLFDCYRPWSVQNDLWKKMPDARYVTRPEKGSMHNRGAAIDLTLIDEDGLEIDMGTEYDFFGEEAYHTFMDLSAEVLAARGKLRNLMQQAGFKHIRTEWWHYSYQGKQYEISDYQWPCP